MNAALSKVILLVWLPAALLATSSPSFAGGEVNLLLGNKWLAAEGGDQTEGFSIALLTTFGRERWPVWVACDVSGNFGAESTPPGWDSTGLLVVSVDIHPGVRKVWDSGRWRTSVGAGPAFHLVVPSVFDSWESLQGYPWSIGAGPAFGVWLSGRCALRFGRFQVGLDARLSRAKSEIELERVFPATTRTIDFESGGQYLGLFIGMGW